MKIKIFFNRSIHENATYYYDLVKEAKEKLVGVDGAISETEKEIKKAQKAAAAASKDSSKVRVKRQKEWFEKFHWLTTENGFLAIGGRSAQQNDQVVAKYLEDEDLFFHADIQGGSATILKSGAKATQSEQEEVAQMAACFSKAWINGNAAVDVYAVGKNKHLLQRFH